MLSKTVQGICYAVVAILTYGTNKGMQLYLLWNGIKLIGMSAGLLHCMTGAVVTHDLLMQQSSHKDDCRLFSSW